MLYNPATDKELNHLIDNWTNARVDPVAAIKSGDAIVEYLKKNSIRVSEAAITKPRTDCGVL